MKKGDRVRARFMTLPAEPYGSSDGPRHKVRVGTVVYVHPKGRYDVVETQLPFGVVREAFRPEEIMT